MDLPKIFVLLVTHSFKSIYQIQTNPTPYDIGPRFCSLFLSVRSNLIHIVLLTDIASPVYFVSVQCGFPALNADPNACSVSPGKLPPFPAGAAFSLQSPGHVRLYTFCSRMRLTSGPRSPSTTAGCILGSHMILNLRTAIAEQDEDSIVSSGKSLRWSAGPNQDVTRPTQYDTNAVMHITRSENIEFAMLGASAVPLKDGVMYPSERGYVPDALSPFGSMDRKNRERDDGLT